MYDPKVAIPFQLDIPIEFLEKNNDIYGNITKASKINPISNTEWDYLYFVDSSVFQPAANAFKLSKAKTKNTGIEPSYTEYLPGTKSYKDFWIEEKRRCLQGYEVGGVRIPGEYYFYLNYCLIKKTNEDSESLDFPNFASFDYYWFLELEKAANNKDMTQRKNIIAAKARRKGFSFKNAAGAVWVYTFKKETTVVIGAQLKEKAAVTFEMCLNMIDFINQYTEFRSPYYRRSYDPKGSCIISSGAKTKKDGREFVKGRKTTILTVSFKDKPDSAAGYGASRIIIDEAGMVPDLKKVFGFTDPVLKDGTKRKGIMIIFGTGGDMENAKDFSEMFYNPSLYDAVEYDNIYEEEETNTKCGWFIDDMWYKPGIKLKVNGKYYESFDSNGNCLKWVAECGINIDRDKARKSSQKDFEVKLTQMCKTPSEAFLITKGNVFPVGELYKILSQLKRDTDISKPYRAGYLLEDKGRVEFVPDMENKLKPMDNYPLKPNEKNIAGAFLQYYSPQFVNGVIPDDAYIIGHDPWGIDAKLLKIDSDSSLGATYVMRTNKYVKELGSPSTIVASYIGRTDTMEEYNYNLYKISKYYGNAKIMYENDRGEIEPYFTKQKALHLLAIPPFNIIRKHGTGNHMQTRRFGFSSANVKFKEIAIKYIYDWLVERRFEDSNYRNMDLIRDQGLLEELVSFNFDKGNFDRIMALMGCVLALENTDVFESLKEDKESQKSFLTANRFFRNN